MRIPKTLPIIAILALTLGGCSTAKTNSVPMTSAAESALKQADSQLPFKVALPSSLPHNLKLTNVMMDTNPNTNKPDSILLQFTSDSASLDIHESKTNGLGHIGFGNHEKDLTVKNMKARYLKDDKRSSLIWFDGEKQTFLSTFANSDIGSEEEMVKIAESFK